MNTINLKELYSSKKTLLYNPIQKVQGFSFRDKIIAFDDRFVVVKNAISKLVNEYGGKKLRMLDVGVGDGVYERMLEKKIIDKLNIFGIDISHKQLERSSRYLYEYKVVDLNSEKIPYKESSFDIILISEILEHVFFPNKVLMEALRVLKPGGKLIITFPNSGSLQLRISLLLFGYSPLLNYPQNVEHIRYFNKKDIVHMLGEGVEILGYTGLGSLLFSDWNFKGRVYAPRLLQILFNRILPQLALGNLLVVKKH